MLQIVSCGGEEFCKLSTFTEELLDEVNYRVYSF